MRKLLLLTIGLILAFAAINICTAKEETVLRDYEGIELPTGSFIRVLVEQEISTAYCDEGSKIKFITTDDLYLHDTNIIPKNSIFFGYIEKINEPVIGTNASMVIKINKLQLTDGFEIPVHGYVYTQQNNLIGGEMTKPEKYVKMPHYQQGFSYGTIQYVPGGTRVMGAHTVIAAGADLMLILSKPLWVTHTVTN